MNSRGAWRSKGGICGHPFIIGGRTEASHDGAVCRRQFSCWKCELVSWMRLLHSPEPSVVGPVVVDGAAPPAGGAASGGTVAGLTMSAMRRPRLAYAS